MDKAFLIPEVEDRAPSSTPPRTLTPVDPLGGNGPAPSENREEDKSESKDKEDSEEEDKRVTEKDKEKREEVKLIPDSPASRKISSISNSSNCSVGRTTHLRHRTRSQNSDACGEELDALSQGGDDLHGLSISFSTMGPMTPVVSTMNKPEKLMESPGTVDLASNLPTLATAQPQPLPGSLSSNSLANAPDRTPRDVYVELLQLKAVDGTKTMEWKESARWIKYEENVEEGVGRWSKPHIAMLSFHSLLELSRGLEFGTVILDLEAKQLPAIVDAIVAKMIENKQIDSKTRGQIRKTLLLKYHKKKPKKKGWSGLFSAMANEKKKGKSGWANLKEAMDKAKAAEEGKADKELSGTEESEPAVSGWANLRKAVDVGKVEKEDKDKVEELEKKPKGSGWANLRKAMNTEKQEENESKAKEEDEKPAESANLGKTMDAGKNKDEELKPENEMMEVSKGKPSTSGWERLRKAKDATKLMEEGIQTETALDRRSGGPKINEALVIDEEDGENIKDEAINAVVGKSETKKTGWAMIRKAKESGKFKEEEQEPREASGRNNGTKGDSGGKEETETNEVKSEKESGSKWAKLRSIKANGEMADRMIKPSNKIQASDEGFGPRQENQAKDEVPSRKTSIASDEIESGTRWGKVKNMMRNGELTNEEAKDENVLPEQRKGSIPTQPNGQNKKMFGRFWKKSSSDLNSDGISVSSEEAEVPEILRRIPAGAQAFTVLVGTVDFLDRPIMGFVRLQEGRMLKNLAEVPLPVRFIFILLGPAQEESSALEEHRPSLPNLQKTDYHEMGRSIATLMINATFSAVAFKAESKNDLLMGINSFLTDSVVLPPGAWDDKMFQKLEKMDNPMRRRRQLQQEKLKQLERHNEMAQLERKGRPFHGALKDLKQRYQHYKSDIKDAFNLQCLFSIIFLLFTSLAPAVTFGSLLADLTGHWLGIQETLISTAFGGVIFALLSAQPLIIVAVTGPLLMFESALFEFSEANEIEFLKFRCLVGLWIAVLAIIVVALEGSVLAAFITRFAEEIIELLVATLFIYEVIKKLKNIYNDHPLHKHGSISDPPLLQSFPTNLTSFNKSDADNATIDCARYSALYNESLKMVVFPFALILIAVTFFITHFLTKFKKSTLLGKTARRMIGNLSVPIALILVIIVDVAIIEDKWSEKLDVGGSSAFHPTSINRTSWFIKPFGLPAWQIFVAVIPAALVFTLIFIESLIACMIVNNPERNLKKGSGYHLDILVIGLLAAGCGLFGIPWLTACPVLSVAHTTSLTVMSTYHAPGEPPRVIEVKEQRVTNFMTSILVGGTIAIAHLVLKEIPVAVLFGVLLYMGVTTLGGLQLLTRVGLFFIPLKHHPRVGYVRKVRTWRMHLYTLLQLISLAVLWTVKATPASIAFPFFLIILIAVRKWILPKIFTDEELEELDNELDDDDYVDDDDDDKDS